MEKKFVKKEDLGEIMEALAERGMAHPEIRVSMDIGTWQGEQILKVRVYDTSYNTLASQDYALVDGLEDEFDVLDQTVEAALAEMEKENAEKAKEEAENAANTEDNEQE